MISIWVSGCGALEPAAPTVLSETPLPPPAETPRSIATAVTESAGGPWIEYRDPRYGYAIALPCYWTYVSTPLEGMFATMSARSYSDEFLGAHSVRGDWENGIWPEGAMKLDVLVFEGIDPALDLMSALEEFFDEYLNEQEVTAIEAVSFGSHSALQVTVEGGLAGGMTSQMVYFRLAPDKLIWFHFQPAAALVSTDAQAILGSVVLSVEEPLPLPLVMPSGRPDDGSIACP